MKAYRPTDPASYLEAFRARMKETGFSFTDQEIIDALKTLRSSRIAVQVVKRFINHDLGFIDACLAHLSKPRSNPSREPYKAPKPPSNMLEAFPDIEPQDSIE